MNSNNDTIEIKYLSDHPEAVPVLKEWFESEWAPYYGPGGEGDAEKDLRESCSSSRLPVALVAFSGGRVCGTAALKKSSVTTHTHLTPWLAALLVVPEFRRRGIAEKLIATVEETARRFDFTEIYAGTGEGPGTPGSTLRKRGWEFIEKKPYFISEILIFRKTLR